MIIIYLFLNSSKILLLSNNKYLPKAAIKIRYFHYILFQKKAIMSFLSLSNLQDYKKEKSISGFLKSCIV